MLDTSNKKISLVFYIGSSEVRGAVVDFRDSQKPKVLYNSKKAINAIEGLDYSCLPDLMVRALSHVSEKIIGSDFWKKSELKVDNIHCVFSSLWYSAKIKEISFKGNKHFTFTEDVLEDAVSEVKEEAEREGGFDKQLIIEQKGVQVRLNGYLVENPYGREALEVTITVFLNSLSRKAYDRVVEVLGNFFNEREIYYHSYVLANFTMINRELDETRSFLLVDVGGEITELLSVYDGTIQQIATFPLGINYFARELSEKNKKSVKEAISELQIFAQGEFEEKKYKEIEEAVFETKENWINDFKDCLSGFSYNLAVPANLYLSSDEKILKWLSSLAKDERFIPYTLLNKPFDVVKMNSHKTAGLVNWKGGSSPDNILSICVGYIHRYIN